MLLSKPSERRTQVKFLIHPEVDIQSNHLDYTKWQNASWKFDSENPRETIKESNQTSKETPFCVSIVEPVSKQLNTLSNPLENTHKCFIDLYFSIQRRDASSPYCTLKYPNHQRMEGRQKAHRLRQIMAVFIHLRLKRPW